MFNFLEKLTGGGGKESQKDELARLEEKEERLKANIKNIEDFMQTDPHRDDAEKRDELKEELKEVRAKKAELKSESEDSDE